jgi:hypothetical protein
VLARVRSRKRHGARFELNVALVALAIVPCRAASHAQNTGHLQVQAEPHGQLESRVCPVRARLLSISSKGYSVHSMPSWYLTFLKHA